MKMPACLAALVCITSPVTLRADQMVMPNDRVRIEVKVDTKTDRKDLPKTSTDSVVQHKTLAISLSGKARASESRVVKWTIYSRNMKSKDIEVAGSGQFDLKLDGNGRGKGESKTVDCAYTPEHGEVEDVRRDGRDNWDGRQPYSKRVEATGGRYAGYSVQVLDGSRVVGEASDPVGIKAK